MTSSDCEEAHPAVQRAWTKRTFKTLKTARRRQPSAASLPTLTESSGSDKDIREKDIRKKDPAGDLSMMD